MSTLHPAGPHLHPLPTTRFGRWSVALLGLCLVSFAVFFLMVTAGQRGGETFFDNWLLTGPIAVAVISATAAALVGLISVVRDTATVDRLLHHAHAVLTEGASYRLAEATAGKGVVPLG